MAGSYHSTSSARRARKSSMLRAFHAASNLCATSTACALLMPALPHACIARTHSLSAQHRVQLRAARFLASAPTVSGNASFSGVPGDSSLAWARYAEVLADTVGHGEKDLGVARQRACLPVGGIPEDGVPASFTKNLAAVCGEVANEIDTLHSTGTARGSRTTSWPSASRLASSRLACTMS